MIQRILVPLDQSAFAEQALARAVTIAKAAGAALDLLLVHEPTPVSGYDAPHGMTHRQHAERKYLDRIARITAARNRVLVWHDVMYGSPVENICERAHATNADLIVMSTHGRTGLARTWVGSVADAVMRHADVPVLLVRARDARTSHAAAAPFAHVLVSVDGSDMSAGILPIATALARLDGARLTMLHVEPTVSVERYDSVLRVARPPQSDQVTTDVAAATARAHLQVLADTVRRDFTVAPRVEVIVSDTPAQAILSCVTDGHVDLIVLRSHGRGASRLLRPSVTDQLLRGCTAQLLVEPRAALPATSAARAAHSPGVPVPA